MTRKYLRAGYRLVGMHSGIQICRWTRAALMGRRLCYKETYKNVTRPLIPDAWERVRASLRLMPRFKRSRTIARLTLVKGQNMHNPEGYSELALTGRPSIIELKGYSWLGESKQRLPIRAMPYHFEMREFARKMEKSTGYEIVAEDPISRVVLLARGRIYRGAVT